MRKEMDEKFLEKLITFSDTLKTPEGWKRTDKLETTDSHFDHPDITIRSESIMIQFRFTFNDENHMSVDGTTEYTTPEGKTFTFDRRGFESSFYLSDPASKYGYGKKLDEVNELVAEQIAKAEEAIKTASTYVTVPKLGFCLTPRRHEAYIKALQGGKPVTLSPRGMGVGYVLHRSHQAAGRWATAAAREIRDFFKVDTLYLETYDHD